MAGGVTDMMSEPGKITHFFVEQSPDNFLDKEVLSTVIAQMVKFIEDALQEKEQTGRYS